MQSYKPLKIFLASPGDVIQERKQFAEIINEVNNIKAHKSGFHLEYVGWENTLPGVGRPQELINSELAECNLFILLFWEKWGTPSGEIYSSGTEEEYYIALESFKKYGYPQMWLFFKSQEHQSLRIDDDIYKINQFRNKVEENREVFYKSYVTVNDWVKSIRGLLCNWIDRVESISISDVKGNNSGAFIKELLFEVSYLDWVYTGKNDRPELYFQSEMRIHTKCG